MLIKQCVIVLGLMMVTVYGQTPYGLPCTNWNECEHFSNVVCRLGICQCRWNWYYVLGATPPCREGLIGDRCNTVDDCDTTDALCTDVLVSGQEICVCPPGYYAVGQDCVAGIIGDRCNTDDDLCIHDDAHCTGPSGDATCSCLTGSYPIQACFEGSIGDPCKTPANCDGADVDCISGVCACPSDWYEVLGDCYLGELGDACNIDDNCITPNAECILDVCTCPGVNPYVINDTCYDGSMGDLCTSDSDCSANIPGSVCTGTPLTCQCPADWWFSGLVCYEAPNEGPGS